MRHIAKEKTTVTASHKKYVDFVTSLCGKYSAWEIWNDFINIYAISISNTFRHRDWENREKQYHQIREKYKAEELEKMAQLSAMLINDMEKAPDSDFLGETYMALQISCKTKGQYFTPYNIAKMMTEMIAGFDHQEPMLVNEPCCGSGVNLIAFANTLKERGFNYQQNAYFVAQDIDPLVAKMCYIQMTLLGMPGVVIIGDSLKVNTAEMEHWYTPFHYLFGNDILSRCREKRIKKSINIQEQIEYEDDWLLNMVGLA